MTTNEKGTQPTTPGAERDDRERKERMAGEPGTQGAARKEDDDPREEEGWSQPESSAQKGAAADEG